MNITLNVRVEIGYPYTGSGRLQLWIDATVKSQDCPANVSKPKRMNAGERGGNEWVRLARRECESPKSVTVTARQSGTMRDSTKRNHLIYLA